MRPSCPRRRPSALRHPRGCDVDHRRPGESTGDEQVVRRRQDPLPASAARAFRPEESYLREIGCSRSVILFKSSSYE